MPRKSVAALAVVSTSKAGIRLAPSTAVADEVRAIFAEIVAAAPANQFRDADGYLVEQYAQAIVLARRAYQQLDERGPVIEGRASPWLTVLEKAHRSSVALSARLRLSPQHRADARSAGRNVGPRASPYGVMDHG